MGAGDAYPSLPSFSLIYSYFKLQLKNIYIKNMKIFLLGSGFEFDRR